MEFNDRRKSKPQALGPMNSFERQMTVALGDRKQLPKQSQKTYDKLKNVRKK